MWIGASGCKIECVCVNILDGKILGKRLWEKNISSVIFDRGIRPYHGCIQALAEGVKEVGLNF